MSACAIPLSRPVPIAEVPVALRLQVVSTAGAGFPSPAQDWEETAIDRNRCFRPTLSALS